MDVWQPYLDTLDEDQREAVLSILERAEKYVPDCERTMSYKMPTLTCKGANVLSVAGWKDHVGVYPHGKELVEDISHLLIGAEVENGSIRFEYNALPTDEMVELIVIRKLQSLK